MNKQELALQKVGEGKNVFITGGGGRGKSYLIHRIKDTYSGEVVVCAPSGSAALLVGGMTAHKMFGLPVELIEDGDEQKYGKTMVSLFSNNVVKKIIIDEVSMLRVDYFTLIDKKLRSIKNKDVPFGGLQIIVVGDFYQLDPVLGFREKEVFNEQYDSTFAFTSESWNFETVNLDVNHRQVNKRQIALLDSIRVKDKNYRKAIDILNSESKEYDPTEDVVHLCCYKKDADQVNRYWYKKLNTPEKVYEASIEGAFGKSEYPVNKKLRLKIGARVMVKVNDPYGKYVNGDVGTVESMKDNCVTVMLKSGSRIYLSPTVWEKKSYANKMGRISDTTDASFTQIPLKLAYGNTVHSAQGCTLDDVVIDFGMGCFSAGQAYVALSRVKNLSNLSFVDKIHYSDVICSKEVKDFYNNIGGL